MATGKTGDFIPCRTLLFSQVVLFGKQNDILYSFKCKDWGQLSFKWIPFFLTCVFFYFWRAIFPSVPWYWVSFWRIPLPVYFLSASTCPLTFSGIEALSVHPCSSRLCSGLPLFQSPSLFSPLCVTSCSLPPPLVSELCFLLHCVYLLYFFTSQTKKEMPVGVTTEWRLGFSMPAYTPPDNLSP